MKLKNKVAVITGGNSGIGLAIAKEFVKEGAKVAVFARNKDALDRTVSELGASALGVQGDVRLLSDIDRLYSETSKKFGKVDVVVANAGIAPMIPLSEITEKAFDEISDINFKGAFFTVQRALPHLNSGASVILVSSAVNQMGMPSFSVYAATKAAVRSLARTLSADLLERGIRVNSLSPGAIDTPIFDKTGKSKAEKEEMAKHIAQMVPMKRFGTSEEMAKAALFLASTDSSYMAGSDLMVDGGIAQL
jgi:NAD(P)-dependent dehydrogenase (short-subunit alcohol dehydrogenase family)